MKTVNGVYTSAKIFTDTIEDYAVSQIQMLCDNETLKGCKVRIMPDVHPGKVGTIGFTSTIGDKMLPNLIGIDIGCGITLARLKKKKVEFQKLDTIIRENVPAGFSIRKKAHRFGMEFDFMRLRCHKAVNIQKAQLSIGTLGGGNHFLELDKDKEENLYVAIHSGSRHLGKEVTEHYLNKGQKYLKKKGIVIPYELTYLEGELKESYLQDLQVVQDFANQNRKAILDELAKGMKWKVVEEHSVVHNYVDFSMKEPVLRKGAISAKKGEIVAIPITMADGILIGEGLGNEEWNYSAPHGSGRKMKREDVKKHYTVSRFKAEMKGIYSSCIGKDTLDEAPFAYRRMEELERQVADSVKIQKRLVPIYNFKAGSKEK
uniref:RtcB family protein n=1 Tax=Agathobacter sp. TaxID=2021311 RepID=UPI004056F549